MAEFDAPGNNCMCVQRLPAGMNLHQPLTTIKVIRSLKIVICVKSLVWCSFNYAVLVLILTAFRAYPGIRFPVLYCSSKFRFLIVRWILNPGSIS